MKCEKCKEAQDLLLMGLCTKCFKTHGDKSGLAGKIMENISENWGKPFKSPEEKIEALECKVEALEAEIKTRIKSEINNADLAIRYFNDLLKTEAKLAKAVEALQKLGDHLHKRRYSTLVKEIDQTLSEIKGE